MGKVKKIGIGIGIAFGIFIVIGIIGSAANRGNIDESDKATNSIEAVPNKSNDGTNLKPLVDLLPTRNDVGTEWVMKSESNNPSDKTLYQYGGGFFTHILKPNEITLVNATGYQEGVVKKYSKANGSGGTIAVWPAIHRFDSSENALNHYDKVVADLRIAGGFKEYDTRGIDAKCYGTLREGSLSDSLDFYCVKSNIYYHVISSTDQMFMADGLQSVKEFAVIVAKKI